jgi:acyl-CoA thioesterase FadM
MWRSRDPDMYFRRSPPEGARSVGTMSMISTRWSVLQEHRVSPDDLGPDGLVTDDAVAGWIAGARRAYLDRCTRLEDVRAGGGFALRDQTTRLPAGAEVGAPDLVAVSASAIEIFPTSFVVALRLRTAGGDTDVALDARSTLRLEDPATGATQEITDEIRDELIALEHAARHFN